MIPAIRSATNEYIELLRRSGLDVSLKETYMGRGFAIIAHERERCYTPTRHVFTLASIEELRGACRELRQQSVTDRLGNPRVRLFDVRARCAETNPKAFGMLVRSCGLSIVNSGGSMWIACDAAWDRFIASQAIVRTPV